MGYEDLLSRLPGYSFEKLLYHCLQLADAGFLSAITTTVLGSTRHIAGIDDLTYPGHQFLADIRSDAVWNKTKNAAKSIGIESLHALKDIAVQVTASMIRNLSP